MPFDSGVDADAINTALLAMRLMLGVIMLAHGINHIIGGGKIEGTAGWFASLGMKPGIFHAWLASITEVVAGVLLVVGLLTPLAAAGVLGVMVVALITNHLKNGFFIFRPGEGYEYVLTLIVFSIAMAMLGPGAWSVDAALGLTETLAGWTGGAIALLGVPAAAGLLAVFWRPGELEAAEG